MLGTVEFILKILFLMLSIVWIGKIMILRTDKQIVINPLLIGMAALLAVLPQSNVSLENFNTGIIISTVIIGFMGARIYFTIPAIFILFNLINNININDCNE